jgi:hypothetical protein
MGATARAMIEVKYITRKEGEVEITEPAPLDPLEVVAAFEKLNERIKLLEEHIDVLSKSTCESLDAVYDNLRILSNDFNG